MPKSPVDIFLQVLSTVDQIQWAGVNNRAMETAALGQGTRAEEEEFRTATDRERITTRGLLGSRPKEKNMTRPKSDLSKMSTNTSKLLFSCFTCTNWHRPKAKGMAM